MGLGKMRHTALDYVTVRTWVTGYGSTCPDSNVTILETNT